ncbi:MAG: hypothetical protein HYX76_11805, partial [Acidobacteria bacterium]|nr:hypothetical protein [Acidobacteriota bacterium]
TWQLALASALPWVPAGQIAVAFTALAPAVYATTKEVTVIYLAFPLICGVLLYRARRGDPNR